MSFATVMPDVLPVRYNLKPGQSVLVMAKPGEAGLMRWQFRVPEASKANGFNVRVETVERAYREPWKHHRCLIQVDGFYEWKQGPSKTPKVPHLFEPRDKLPYTFAGVVGEWTDKKTGEVTPACAIVTGPSQGIVSELHTRMPLVVSPGDRERWLDPGLEDTKTLKGLLNDDASGYDCRAVSTKLNFGVEGPEVLMADLPPAPAKGQLGLF
jgi:putative SOS response-associated peptidase YedK